MFRAACGFSMFGAVSCDISVKYMNEEIDFHLQPLIMSRGERFICEFNIVERSWP